MAISKRTRFEVLRRDENTCQYCGQSAPDVVLHVDHVEPVSLGGSDKPDNLLTACQDCNLGKASIAPDSPLVESVGGKAAAYAFSMTTKMTELRASIEQGDEYLEEFRCTWDTFTCQGQPIPKPIDYESSLHRWFNMGVPIRLVEMAIKRAMVSATSSKPFPEFTYMCGVIWNQINAGDIDYSVTAETVKVFTYFEANEMECNAWSLGFDAGRAREKQTQEGEESSEF
jgi:hypothetical protein